MARPVSEGRRAWTLRTAPLLRSLVFAYEERLTPRGRFLLWATAVFALVGLDTRRTQVFVLFAVAAGILVVSLLVNLFPRPRVRLECELPERATALVPLVLRARVFSVDGRALPDLRLGFPRPRRWGSSLRFTPREELLSVPAGRPAEVTVRFEALRRGRYELPAPTVRSTDPLRLAASQAVAGEDRTLLVYPRFYTVESLDVPRGRRYQPGGIPLSSSTGDAIEFVGTREYREGDPLRNIHWRSFARVGFPVVKEYQEEYFCRIAIVLDTFLPRRMGEREVRQFEAGISVVASIADHFSRSEAVVDILAAGPDLYEVSAGRSLAYLENILDVLACLEPCHEPPFATVGPPLFDKLSRITTLVAVVQDWDEAREGFLRNVKALGTAVRTIVVKEGETARPWQAAAEELGVSPMSPADVERAIAASAGSAVSGPTAGRPGEVLRGPAA